MFTTSQRAFPDHTLFLGLPWAPEYLIFQQRPYVQILDHQSAALGTRELRSLKAAFPPVLRRHAGATTRV
jgi:hypothetical protein